MGAININIRIFLIQRKMLQHKEKVITAIIFWNNKERNLWLLWMQSEYALSCTVRNIYVKILIDLFLAVIDLLATNLCNQTDTLCLKSRKTFWLKLMPCLIKALHFHAISSFEVLKTYMVDSVWLQIKHLCGKFYFIEHQEWTFS